MLPVKPFPATGGPNPLAGGSWDRVSGLSMVGQQEANWCWAAIIQSILTLRKGNSPSQQDLVTFHLQKTGRNYTCAPPNRDKPCGGTCRPGHCTACCNDVHNAEATLSDHHLFQAVLSALGPPAFDQIQQEIGDNHPIPAQVKWSSGGGHIFLVNGWTLTPEGKQGVYVLDPASTEGGKQVVEKHWSYDSFAYAYQQQNKQGVVTFSYKLRPVS